MFWLSGTALRAEDLCVFESDAAPGEELTLIPGDADAPDRFFCLVSGSAVLYDGDTALTAFTGAVYLPHSAGYRIVFSDNARYIHLIFRLYEDTVRQSPPHELIFTADFLPEFRQMADTICHAGPVGALSRQAAFFAILSKAAPEFAAAFTPSLSKIARGVAALEAHFLENTAIADYAALCGLRENRFRLLFSVQYGMSPVEYRNTLRMQYARILIRELHCSITAAAQASGFSSTSYFCRLHRKLYGVSPAGEEAEHDKMDDLAGS